MSKIYSSKASPNLFGTDGQRLSDSGSTLDNSTVFGVPSNSGINGVENATGIKTPNYLVSRSIFIYGNSTSIEDAFASTFNEFGEIDGHVSLIYFGGILRNNISKNQFIVTDKGILAQITEIRPFDSNQIDLENGDFLFDESDNNLLYEQDFNNGVMLKTDIKSENRSLFFKESGNLPARLITKTTLNNNTTNQYIALGLPTKQSIAFVSDTADGVSINKTVKIRTADIASSIRAAGYNYVLSNFLQEPTVSEYNIGEDKATSKNNVTFSLGL